jgi:hypothetical protein
MTSELKRKVSVTLDADLLDCLATERGGLDSVEDEQAIHRLMRLLGGSVTESTPPMNPGHPHPRSVADEARLTSGTKWHEDDSSFGHEPSACALSRRPVVGQMSPSSGNATSRTPSPRPDSVEAAHRRR